MEKFQSGKEKPQSKYSIHVTKNTHTHTHTHITKQYKTTTAQIKTNTVRTRYTQMK
jgi:hypothetical protein